MDNAIFQGFWKNLAPGFRVLAPMEEVTDLLFRDVLIRAGRPDVFFTEFVGAKHLIRGESEALRRLEFHENHHPIVAQIWGTDPRDYYECAQLLVSMGFDGIDINMGCPQPKITKKGACSALILNPGLAKELIDATKEGIGNSGRPVPVSVKTRVGFDEVQTERWCGFLLDQGLAALTVHGRIATQMSEGQADWQQITRVVDLRNTKGIETRIIGNGDLVNHYQLETYTERFGVDGLMVGRGIFDNLFLFKKQQPDTTHPVFHDLSPREHVQWALEHLNSYEHHYGGRRNSEIMKKFFKIYLSDFPGADEVRSRIMDTTTYDDARRILLELLVRDGNLGKI